MWRSNRVTVGSLPSIDDVIALVNTKANAGLPFTKYKKRDFSGLFRYYLQQLYNGRFYNFTLGFPSAAFPRNQLKGSEWKFRLVFCVDWYTVLIELPYWKMFTDSIVTGSDYVFKQTQTSIAKRVQETCRGKHNYSLDSSKFD